MRVFLAYVLPSGLENNAWGLKNSGCWLGLDSVLLNIDRVAPEADAISEVKGTLYLPFLVWYCFSGGVSRERLGGYVSIVFLVGGRRLALTFAVFVDVGVVTLQF